MIALGISVPPELYARLGLQDELNPLIAADPALAESQAVFMGAVDLRRHDLVRWLIA